MYLIPAILHIVKPTVFSIDKKGKATMKISLLSLAHKDQTNATTRTKSYRTLKEDHIIIVSSKKNKNNLYHMESIIGPTSDIRHWETILPLRIGLYPIKQHVPITLPSFHTLTPQTPPAYPFRKFILIDSPGTVDREDGIWWDSNENYGVFTIDIPTQKGWTHNTTPCIEFLASHLFNFFVEQNQLPPTRTFYLPSTRLPMIDSKYYTCISNESLERNIHIPILCYNIPQNHISTSYIHKENEILFASTEDDPSTFPTWYHQCPLSNMSVADCNITMNSKWFQSDSIQSFIISRPHPDFPNSIYAPITSPIRNMGDLWNQCILHDCLIQQPMTKLNSCVSTLYPELQQQCIRDLEKSKFLKTHATHLRLYQTIFQTMKDMEPIFRGTICFKSETFGILETKQHTFWIPKEQMGDSEVGDSMTIKCRLRRHSDPLRMIQVVNTEMES
jgi:hypothetical protein